MKALIVNRTLEPSPERSNTEALAEVVAAALRKGGVEVDQARALAGPWDRVPGPGERYPVPPPQES